MGCSTQKEYITEYDYSFHGKFKKYKTFQFMKIEETDTSALRVLLEKAIGTKLYSQGYRYTEKKPDLFIGYKLYEKDFKMTGYQQPDLERYVYGNWNEKLIDENDQYIDPPPSGRPDTEYYANQYKMRQGTLLVTFYDRKRDRTVWTGYASGVFARQDENVVRSIKVATGKILKEFRLVANGYVVN